MSFTIIDKFPRLYRLRRWPRVSRGGWPDARTQPERPTVRVTSGFLTQKIMTPAVRKDRPARNNGME